VLDLLKVPNGTVQNSCSITDADWHRAIWDVMYSFWSDSDQTTDDVITKRKDEYNAIFG